LKEIPKEASIPSYQLIFRGKKSLEKGIVEVKIRKTGEKKEIPPKELLSFVSDFLGREKSR